MKASRTSRKISRVEASPSTVARSVFRDWNSYQIGESDSTLKSVGVSRNGWMLFPWKVMLSGRVRRSRVAASATEVRVSEALDLARQHPHPIPRKHARRTR